MTSYDITESSLMIFFNIYFKFLFTPMIFFELCLTFVYYAEIILCTKKKKGNSFKPSKSISDKKYNEIKLENINIIREFSKKYDFCSLINTIKDVQDRLEINDMKSYARYTYATFLNILKELSNEAEKVKDLSVYSYAFNFLSNSIYLIENFLNAYEKNLNNNCKFLQEIIRRVSLNFERVERMFSVVENLSNEIENNEKLSELNLIRSGVFGLKKNTDVMVKVFDLCKTYSIFDYQNHNSIIINQLTEFKKQLEKIKDSVSITSEFKIINQSEFFKKDFINETSDFYQNLIKWFQNDIEDLNLVFEISEDILNGTEKSIDELKSYNEMLSRQ